MRRSHNVSHPLIDLLSLSRWVTKATDALCDFHKFYIKINDPAHRSSLDVPKAPLFQAYRSYRDAMKLWESIDLCNSGLLATIHPHVKRTLILARMSANAVQPRVVALHIINKIERANTQVSIGERLSRADSSLRECLKNKKQTEAMHLREEVINVKLSVSRIFRIFCIFSETLFRK